MTTLKDYPPKNKKGFVYILSNVSMPGIVKVGRTSRVPEERIKDKDLCSTGVPTPFIVEYYAFFDDMFKAEREAHINLKSYSHGKEFFKVDIPTATKEIERVQIDSIEIYPHKERSTVVIHCLDCLKDNEFKADDVKYNVQGLICRFCKNTIFNIHRLKPEPVTKKCQKCGRFNTIPEHIRYHERPVCMYCSFPLFDKINTVEKIIEMESPKEFKSIIKLCPMCKSKNKIPEYIKHNIRLKCGECGGKLLDNISDIEKTTISKKNGQTDNAVNYKAGNTTIGIIVWISFACLYVFLKLQN